MYITAWNFTVAKNSDQLKPRRNTHLIRNYSKNKSFTIYMEYQQASLETVLGHLEPV